MVQPHIRNCIVDIAAHVIPSSQVASAKIDLPFPYATPKTPRHAKYLSIHTAEHSYIHSLILTPPPP